MLSGARSFAGRVLDPVTGRQELNEINVYERVLDTGDRTINVDTIATLTIGVIPYRLVRWIIWALAVGAALLSINGLISAYVITTQSSFSFATIFVVSAIGYAAIAVGLFFLGRWFRDVTVLIIGASDGSRTVFRSKDPGYLHEVKNFLARKINENDLSAKLAANFENAVSQPITQNIYGGTFFRNDGQLTVGDGNQIAHNSPNAIVGNANLRVNGHANRIGTHETSYVTNGSPGAQLGNGHTALANQIDNTHVDFSQLLPQIVELQRFYAQHPDMNHIEQRLSELELLMRSGAATPEHRSRVRTLAADLSTILQSYPTMVQLFGHISHISGA